MATVKTGITVITTAIITVTVVTFCHEWLARFFFLTYESEMRLIVIGLFLGGLSGGLGAVITVTGFFRASGGREVRILPVLLFLAVAVILFFALFYSSLENPRQPRPRPGETVTI
jgi:hypothetical protein